MRLALTALVFSALTVSAQEAQIGKAPNFYSREKEVALGKGLAQQVQRNSTPVDNADALAYIEQIGAKLAAQLPQPRFDYKFGIITNTGETSPEALSVPGGFVFVQQRLILAAQNDSELAGILAHAMSHIAARHGTRGATQGMVSDMGTIPLIFYGGWTGYGAQQARGVVVPVAFAKLRDTFEREADTVALNLLSAAGYDPSALVRYFARNLPEGADRDHRIAAMQTALTNLSASDEFLRIQQELRN